MLRAKVIYHFEPEGWWAESTDYPGYTAFGKSLGVVRALVAEGLPLFADDPALEIDDGFDRASTVAYFAITSVNVPTQGDFAGLRQVEKSRTSSREPEPAAA